ncbi:MAG TPA: cellulase family glycosylhydrolase [Phycisphaerae bacterium]|nr:cellulase family glycosylhydrolase [Phycisphaerae bacterium]HRW52654.1 cellulase family glycosylhydrolase [Phycisphaerae bacterium]
MQSAYGMTISLVARWSALGIVGVTLACGTNEIPDVGGSNRTTITTCNGCTKLPAGWLFTSGARILISDGKGGGSAFHGRGANLQDTRGCVACLWDAEESPQEVMRRADELIDRWGANFVRLTLESHAPGSQPFAKHGDSILADDAYFSSIIDIVRHMTAKGVVVLVSLWIEPTFDEFGAPTVETDNVWRKLAGAFVDEPGVMFGICNEPEYNFDGARDAIVWAALNRAASVIREVEQSAGAANHVILAQGLGDWARRLDYFVDHPISAGDGGNIAYEIHYYNPIGDLDRLLAGPAATLPVVIGEFGPIDEPDAPTMTLEDCRQLMDFAMSKEIPFLAWTFHQNCPPNLIENDVGDACGVGMELRPTAWGRLLQEYLAKAW